MGPSSIWLLGFRVFSAPSHEEELIVPASNDRKAFIAQVTSDRKAFFVVRHRQARRGPFIRSRPPETKAPPRMLEMARLLPGPACATRCAALVLRRRVRPGHGRTHSPRRGWCAHAARRARASHPRRHWPVVSAARGHQERGGHDQQYEFPHVASRFAQ